MSFLLRRFRPVAPSPFAGATRVARAPWRRHLQRALATLVAATGTAWAADPVEAPRDAPCRWVSGLCVQVVGQGRPIIFLHGGLRDFASSFARQRDDFATSHTVIGIDQRGHGHSPDDARPFSYQEMAEDTAEVIRHLGLGGVDVVGHSDGGNVGLKLAQAHPELVRHLVVSGASLRPDLPPDEVQRRLAWSPEQLAAFLPKLEQQLPPAFRRDHDAVTPEGAGHWPVFLAKSYRLWLTPVVLTPATLRSIQVPVLVIAGDHDFASLEDTAEIFRGLAKAQLFVVPGAGHGTFSDRPELVDLAIRQFLQGGP